MNANAGQVFVFDCLTNADEESLENYGEALKIATPAKFAALNAAGSFMPVSLEQVSSAASIAGKEFKRIFGAAQAAQ